MASASLAPTLGCVPARACSLRSSARIGSGAFLAAYSQCSIVDRPKRTRSPVVGCTYTRDASSSSCAPSSPDSGGDAKSGPMIEKRRRAHRTRVGVLSSWLMASVPRRVRPPRPLPRPYENRPVVGQHPLLRGRTPPSQSSCSPPAPVAAAAEPPPPLGAARRFAQLASWLAPVVGMIECASALRTSGSVDLLGVLGVDLAQRLQELRVVLGNVRQGSPPWVFGWTSETNPLRWHTANFEGVVLFAAASLRPSLGSTPTATIADGRLDPSIEIRGRRRP